LSLSRKKEDTDDESDSEVVADKDVDRLMIVTQVSTAATITWAANRERGADQQARRMQSS
jgi:hypothetical protein